MKAFCVSNSEVVATHGASSHLSLRTSKSLLKRTYTLVNVQPIGTVVRGARVHWAHRLVRGALVLVFIFVLSLWPPGSNLLPGVKQNCGGGKSS